MNTENKVHSTERPGPEKRLEFEKVLVDASARLVALPPDRVDGEIRSILKEVLKFFEIDHFNLLRLLPGGFYIWTSRNRMLFDRGRFIIR